METLGERIKKVRFDAGLTQVAFSARIGLKQNSIALIESGARNTSDLVTNSICREFSINPDWLKTGNGPMKMPADEADMGKLERIMYGDNEFVKGVFRGLADLPAEAWEAIEKFLDTYTKKDR